MLFLLWLHIFSCILQLMQDLVYLLTFFSAHFCPFIICSRIQSSLFVSNSYLSAFVCSLTKYSSIVSSFCYNTENSKCSIQLFCFFIRCFSKFINMFSDTSFSLFVNFAFFTNSQPLYSIK